jgi:hypothetical protein
MLPPAPGRLSTTTCWPSLSLSRGTIIRTTASVLPPGGNVTTMRIGLLGKSGCVAGAWACADRTPAASSAAAARKNMFIDCLLVPRLETVSMHS